jgi:hypothetical protein
VLEKGLRCILCGTAPWEWEENKYAYEAVEKGCQGCYVKEVTSHDTTRNPGVTVELNPTGTREAAQRRIAARDKDKRRAQAKRDKAKAAGS